MSSDSSTPTDELRLAQASVLAALLQRVGFALWQAAECEDTLAHYLVVRVHATQGMGETAGMKLLEEAHTRPFGGLLTELRKQGVLEPDIDERLKVLLKERNWLVHRAKRENRGLLNAVTNIDALVARLAWIAEEATDVQTLLARKLEEFVTQSGVSRATIDHEAEKLLSDWGY